MRPPSRLRLLPIAMALAFAAGTTDAPQASAQANTPLYDASVRTLKNTQLNYPDNAPFHAKISVTDSHPDTNRKATIEMWWMSPTKYRRVIESPDFSQTRVVNGEAVSEENKGAYFPYWLQEVVDGFFDPIPYLDALKQMPRTIKVELQLGGRGQLCGDITMRVDRWMVCFDKQHTDEFLSVFQKGYSVQFSDYQKFAGKHIAHKIITQQDNQHEIDSTITVLNELDRPDESLFAVTTPTPAAQQIRNLQISEDSFRKLVIGGMDVAWPTIVGGSGKGGCGMFVSADREGNVREGFYGGCDNAAMQEPLRLAALKWKLHPAVQNGAPVQVTSLLGIPYDIHVEPAPPVTVLAETDARTLASNTVEPTFPHGTKRGIVVPMEISVDDDGRLLGTTSQVGTKLPFDVSLAASLALSKWKFTPYVQDGKPAPFKSTITFTTP